jgi:hypothetical protein
MGWKDVGPGGSSSLPLLKVDKPVRIRIIGGKSCPDIADSKKFADGAQQAWTHWAPDELAESLGGSRSTPCIDVKNGCIFHQEPLKWRSGKSNWVNIVVYEGADGRKMSYDSRKILVFTGGVKIFQQIFEQSNGMDLDPDEVDWQISKSGKGRDTVWVATMIQKLMDETISLNEFEEQPEFADEEYPMLIDVFQFDAFAKDMTPATQREWYEKLVTPKEGAETAPATASETSAEPPAAPAGAATKPVAAAPKIGIKTPGAKPGRPPKAKEEPAAEATATPVAAAKTKPNPAYAEYIAATEMLDPWGVDMLHSEYLDFMADMEGPDTEYGITTEHIAAAKLARGGAPSETISVGPATPPKPAAPAAKPTLPKPAPAAAVAAEPEAAAEGIEDARAKLLTLTKSSVLLKSFKPMNKFLKTLAGGVKSVNAIEDLELVNDLIELIESGDENVQSALDQAE